MKKKKGFSSEKECKKVRPLLVKIRRGNFAKMSSDMVLSMLRVGKSSKESDVGMVWYGIESGRGKRMKKNVPLI